MRPFTPPVGRGTNPLKTRVVDVLFFDLASTGMSCCMYVIHGVLEHTGVRLDGRALP